MLNEGCPIGSVPDQPTCRERCGSESVGNDQAIDLQDPVYARFRDEVLLGISDMAGQFSRGFIQMVQGGLNDLLFDPRGDRIPELATV